MPSGSGNPDTKDRDSPDETTPDDSSAGTAMVAYRVHSSSHTRRISPGRLRDRVRIFSLEAEVAVLERERATLKEQITVLESEVESLESEIAALEATIADENRHLQQLINQYEQIITEKDRIFQARIEESDHPQANHRWSMASRIKQLIVYLTDRGNREHHTDK